MECRGYAILLAVLLAATFDAPLFADELLYRYDGNVLPSDEASGLVVANPCEAPACFEKVENGHLILEWAETNEDLVNFHRWISIAPASPPPSLWVEWRYRSNQLVNLIRVGCDGAFSVHYRSISDAIHLHGDAAFSGEGGDSAQGLTVNEFHSYRFESSDGSNFRFSVDGLVFYAEGDISLNDHAYIQFSGKGGCGNLKRSTLGIWSAMARWAKAKPSRPPIRLPGILAPRGTPASTASRSPSINRITCTSTTWSLM